MRSTDGPLADVTLIVEGDGVQLEGRTGPLGMVVFRHPAIVGRVTVHGVRLGYRTWSAVGIGARVLTWVMAPTTAAQYTLTEGRVTGWHRLPATTASVVRFGRVSAAGASLTPLSVDAWQEVREGTSNPMNPSGIRSNIVIESGGLLGWPSFLDYRLAHFDPVTALVVIAGSIDVTDGMTSLTHLGVADGSDIEITHALSEAVVVTASPPRGFAVASTSAFVDIGGAQIALGDRLPRLEGALDGGRYGVVVTVNTATVGDERSSTSSRVSAEPTAGRARRPLARRPACTR